MHTSENLEVDRMHATANIKILDIKFQIFTPIYVK